MKLWLLRRETAAVDLDYVSTVYDKIRLHVRVQNNQSVAYDIFNRITRRIHVQSHLLKFICVQIAPLNSVH